MFIDRYTGQSTGAMRSGTNGGVVGRGAIADRSSARGGSEALARSVPISCVKQPRGTKARLGTAVGSVRHLRQSGYLSGGHIKQEAGRRIATLGGMW